MSHVHNVYDTDKHFLIDPNTRRIENQSKSKITLIQNDHNSERFTFQIPRYVEEHDMSLSNKVEVHFINIASDNSEKNEDVYPVTDLQVSPDSEDVVICSWLISRQATKHIGTLHFALRFACLTGETVDYDWRTGIYSDFPISETIFNSEQVVADYSDVLEQWKNDIFDAVVNEANSELAGAVEEARMTTAVIKEEASAATADMQEQVSLAVDNANEAAANANAQASLAAEAVSSAEAYANVLEHEVSGEIVHVEDALPWPLLETTVYGQSEQMRTTGKNILKTNTLVPETNNGITWTPLEDGSIKVQGTATGPATYNLSFALFELPEAELTCSTTSDLVRMSVGYFDENGAAVENLGDSSLNPTFMGNGMMARVYIVTIIGDTVDTIIYPQIEIGSKATAWEPYTGGAPSPSPDYPQDISSITSVDLVTTGSDISDETIISIDLQGNELRSLRDGTQDELIIDAAGNYGITKRVGVGTLPTKVTFSENAPLNDTYSFFVVKDWLTVFLDGVPVAPEFEPMCDIFNGVEWDYAAFNSVECIWGATTSFGVRIKESRLSEYGVTDTSTNRITAFKAWLEANPVTFYYPLAKPVYIPIGTLDILPEFPEPISNAWAVTNLGTSIKVKYVRDVNEYIGGLVSGKDGATFVPAVDANGNLSWTNNKGLENPDPVNIKTEVPTNVSAFVNDAGYLTEVPESVTSWDELEGKPFYENVEIIATCAYDADSEHNTILSYDSWGTIKNCPVYYVSSDILESGIKYKILVDGKVVGSLWGGLGSQDDEGYLTPNHSVDFDFTYDGIYYSADICCAQNAGDVLYYNTHPSEPVSAAGVYIVCNQDREFDVESMPRFELATVTLKQIDEKFLPATVAMKDDIPEPFSGYWEDLKNKPFYEYFETIASCAFDENSEYSVDLTEPSVRMHYVSSRYIPLYQFKTDNGSFAIRVNGEVIGYATMHYSETDTAQLGYWEANFRGNYYEGLAVYVNINANTQIVDEGGSTVQVSRQGVYMSNVEEMPEFELTLTKYKTIDKVYLPDSLVTEDELVAKGYQTADQVNALINTALGVIENGSY